VSPASGKKSFDAFAIVEKLAALSKLFLNTLEKGFLPCAVERGGNAGSMIYIDLQPYSPGRVFLTKLLCKRMEIYTWKTESSTFGLMLQAGKGTYAVRSFELNKIQILAKWLELAWQIPSVYATRLPTCTCGRRH
jgi:hypothetical protein